MSGTFFYLSAKKLALFHIISLIADEYHSSEELSIGLSVLQHPHLDTRTVLEQRLPQLKNADCSEINPSREKRG